MKGANDLNYNEAHLVECTVWCEADSSYSFARAAIPAQPHERRIVRVILRVHRLTHFTSCTPSRLYAANGTAAGHR